MTSVPDRIPVSEDRFICSCSLLPEPHYRRRKRYGRIPELYDDFGSFAGQRRDLTPPYREDRIRIRYDSRVSHEADGDWYYDFERPDMIKLRYDDGTYWRQPDGSQITLPYVDAYLQTDHIPLCQDSGPREPQSIYRDGRCVEIPFHPDALYRVDTLRWPRRPIWITKPRYDAQPKKGLVI